MDPTKDLPPMHGYDRIYSIPASSGGRPQTPPPYRAPSSSSSFSDDSSSDFVTPPSSPSPSPPSSRSPSPTPSEAEQVLDNQPEDEYTRLMGRVEKLKQHYNGVLGENPEGLTDVVKESKVWLMEQITETEKAIKRTDPNLNAPSTSPTSPGGGGSGSQSPQSAASTSRSVHPPGAGKPGHTPVPASPKGGTTAKEKQPLPLTKAELAIQSMLFAHAKELAAQRQEAEAQVMKEAKLNRLPDADGKQAVKPYFKEWMELEADVDETIVWTEKVKKAFGHRCTALLSGLTAYQGDGSQSQHFKDFVAWLTKKVDDLQETIERSN